MRFCSCGAFRPRTGARRAAERAAKDVDLDKAAQALQLPKDFSKFLK